MRPDFQDRVRKFIRDLKEGRNQLIAAERVLVAYQELVAAGERARSVKSDANTVAVGRRE